MAREEELMTVVILWFIWFNGAVHWSLCWRDLCVTLSGLAFNCNITDFYHYALIHPLQNFHTSQSGAPQKCFQSGPALANAGPANNDWRSAHFLQLLRCFLFVTKNYHIFSKIVVLFASWYFLKKLKLKKLCSYFYITTKHFLKKFLTRLWNTTVLFTYFKV